VDDRFRLGGRHRFAHRDRIQSIHHNAFGAQPGQQVQLGRARRGRRHLVAAGHELRHQPPPQDPRTSRHEHSHEITFPTPVFER
jgi:hypothetical protein